MTRPARLVAITLGLLAAGVAAGALMAYLAVVLVGLLYGSWESTAILLRHPQALAPTFLRGAAVGAVVGPPVAWALLRRVPLWAAVGGTALAGLLGVMLSTVLGGNIIVAQWAAVAGALVAAGALRHAYRPRGADGSNGASGASRTTSGQSPQSLPAPGEVPRARAPRTTRVTAEFAW